MFKKNRNHDLKLIKIKKRFIILHSRLFKNNKLNKKNKRNIRFDGGHRYQFKTINKNTE